MKTRETAHNLVSSGGVVIYQDKVLLLYKNQNKRHTGWVMPKGTVEENESFRQAALREVKEESGVIAKAVKYLGKTWYSFRAVPHAESGTAVKTLSKTVHWYLMTTNSFFCTPQAEEHFADVGFYKKHEAYHLLKFHDERQIMRRAYKEYEKHQTKHIERTNKS